MSWLWGFDGSARISGDGLEDGIILRFLFLDGTSLGVDFVRDLHCLGEGASF